MILVILVFASLIVTGQDKKSSASYNQIIDLKGTNYVIASGHISTKISIGSRYLLFINTLTGDTTRFNCPKGAYIGKIQQIKIDSLNINKVIVFANTVNLDNNKSIDWNDPDQVFVFSTDGKIKTQITDDNFFSGTFEVNYKTGVIVITGHSDTNDNKKYDENDKSEIILYDLKKMELIKKI